MNETRIPFNRPAIVGRELEYVANAFHRGHISGDGHYTQRCHELLEEITHTRKAFLTTSCTHALEMAALLLELGAEDEFIVPSFTFVSTANSFALRGATPVFADIRRDTLNIDESRLDGMITEKTRAIVVVHYAGVGCEMDEILRIAAKYELAVVEDTAHGLFGRYRGRSLGTFGQLAALSFHETKNVSCGEGGALLINDDRYRERAEIIREKGTNRSKFFRGEIDKYSWVDLGSSYLPSEVLAAILLAQLEERHKIQTLREKIWRSYASELAPWAADLGIRLPVVPTHCEQPFHMFYLLLPTPEDRDEMIKHLRSRGVLAVFHYLPLHRSIVGSRLARHESSCPVTEEISARLLRLPFYTTMSEAEQEYVMSAVKEFTPARAGS